MSRIILISDRNKSCYKCKYIKFNNGYGSCSFNNRSILVDESNYCDKFVKFSDLK